VTPPAAENPFCRWCGCARGHTPKCPSYEAPAEGCDFPDCFEPGTAYNLTHRGGWAKAPKGSPKNHDFYNKDAEIAALKAERDTLYDQGLKFVALADKAAFDLETVTIERDAERSRAERAEAQVTEAAKIIADWHHAEDCEAVQYDDNDVGLLTGEKCWCGMSDLRKALGIEEARATAGKGA
jgi:hypothetical protein